MELDVLNSMYYYYPNRLCLSETLISMLPVFVTLRPPDLSSAVNLEVRAIELRSLLGPCPVTVIAPRIPPVPKLRPLCSRFHAASCSLFQLLDSFGSYK